MLSGPFRKLSFLFAAVVILSGCSNSETTETPSSDLPEKDFSEMLERVGQRKAERDALNNLQKGVLDFQLRFGRLPTNLVEIATYNVIPELPQAPEGYTFVYNAQLGNVSLRTIPKDSREAEISLDK